MKEIIQRFKQHPENPHHLTPEEAAHIVRVYELWCKIVTIYVADVHPSGPSIIDAFLDKKPNHTGEAPSFPEYLLDMRKMLGK